MKILTNSKTATSYFMGFEKSKFTLDSKAETERTMGGREGSLGAAGERSPKSQHLW